MIQPEKTKAAALGKVPGLLLQYNTIIIFGILFVASVCLSDRFLTSINIFNLLRQHAGLMMISMGMLAVILTGGIDLSVGAQVALASVLSGYFLMMEGMSPFLALVCTIGCNLLIGVVEGYFVAYRKMAPFVVTLAFMTIARGLAYILSKGTPIRIRVDSVLEYGAGGLWGVPYPVWTAAVVVTVMILILRFTVYGRFVKAIGANENAVRLSGVRVNLYKASTYILSACFCALAGFVSMARSGVGSPVIGEGLESDAIAAVVIGGASLAGGKGTAFNALLGVFILAMIGNIMNLINIASYPQQVIKGGIILAAVFMHGLQSRK
ncbi:MAG: ABC transporter permease [Candidatus Limiplasma sp.]|nr:ABC transporter permease [Candidatus Limiplasma sp.]